MKRLRPDVSALVVLGKLAVVFMHCVISAVLQRFSHRLMQQSAPRPPNVTVDHFAKLVVAEVVYATFWLLAQQATLDERFHRVY